MPGAARQALGERLSLGADGLHRRSAQMGTAQQGSQRIAQRLLTLIPGTTRPPVSALFRLPAGHVRRSRAQDVSGHRSQDVLDVRRLATCRLLWGRQQRCALAQRASKSRVGRHLDRFGADRQLHRSVGCFQDHLVVVDAHAQALPLPAHAERQPADAGRQRRVNPQPPALDTEGRRSRPPLRSTRRPGRRCARRRRCCGAGPAGRPAQPRGRTGAPGRGDRPRRT